MRAAVVYDTVSPAKVTGKVAEMIGESLKNNGVSVDSFFVEDANKADLGDYDCLVIGAPTMAWRPSERMKGFLTSMRGKPISSKMAATFDTQLKSAFSGNATKHMEKDLQDMGLKIVMPSLLAYVETKDKKYQLKDGETQKIQAWGQELAKVLSKNG